MERFPIVYTLYMQRNLFLLNNSGKACERRPCFLEYAFSFRFSGERVLFSIISFSLGEKCQ